MNQQNRCCDLLENAIRDPEYPITEIAKFREIGLTILDGGDSVVILAYCPWCGSRLPASLRDQWFNELERRNIDPDGTEIPNQFLTAEWYRDRP